ncbi:MogA/MoaB family molybdenum cofactor biosynthesis protein [Halomicrobium salinisoli]|uniref:MogA/MoaB family molybdenum cofactor biosynthesis protein n=1 Tax=Halomicrobium salinisoli TaxID=2878391 RepID=UPI001CF03D5A|nr:molybdopterin-binding protein [Halomicrobium salinisoli]
MIDFQSRGGRRDRGADENGETEDADESGAGDDEPSDDGEEPPATADAGQVPESHDDRVGVAVVTVAVDADQSVGDAVVEEIDGTGLGVATREHLAGDHDGVQQIVNRLVGRDDVDVVVTCGGVSALPDAETVEAVHPLFDKALPGFGELFRLLYHEEVGTDVVATRATAGIADSTPVFCLPGDEAGARLGVREIVTEQAASLWATASGSTE